MGRFSVAWIAAFGTILLRCSVADMAKQDAADRSDAGHPINLRQSVMPPLGIVTGDNGATGASGARLSADDGGSDAGTDAGNDPWTDAGNDGALALAPPFGLTQIIHTGQSLGMGYQGGVHSTAQAYRNFQLDDSAAAYDITNPGASTLSMVPLVAPERANATASTIGYPNNFSGGEAPDVAMANTIAWAAAAAGYPSYDLLSTNVAQGGAPIDTIAKGGKVEYAASLYETSAAKAMAPGLGYASFGARCIVLTEGEADAGNRSIEYYVARVQTMLADYRTDLAAITGQASPVYMILSQQTSGPVNYGPDTTAMATWVASKANPIALLSGPKYPYPFAQDHVHFRDYRPYGEKLGEVYMVHEAHLLGKGPDWAPLEPTSITRSGRTVTVSLNVPVGPLVVDGSVSPPHQSGKYAAWAKGNGFEAYDNRHQILSLSGSGVSPIAVTLTDDGKTPVFTGLKTGDAYALTGAYNYPNASGLFTVTVTSPTTFTLDGTVGSTFSGGGFGIGFSPIEITSSVVVGDTVRLTLGREPASQLWVGAADNADAASNVATGGFGLGRFTVLHDSDPWKPTFFGASGSDNYNWLISFRQPVP